MRHRSGDPNVHFMGPQRVEQLNMESQLILDGGVEGVGFVGGRWRGVRQATMQARRFIRPEPPHTQWHIWRDVAVREQPVHVRIDVTETVKRPAKTAQSTREVGHRGPVCLPTPRDSSALPW